MTDPWQSNADATTEASFTHLEYCLAQLRSLSPVSDPSQIRDLIPETAQVSGRLIAIELIKYDMAMAAELGVARNIDFYLSKFEPWLSPDNIPFDLVLEEIQLRRESGEEPAWTEYRKRYPQMAATLGRWLAGDEYSASLSSEPNIPKLEVNQQFDDFFILASLGQGAFAQVYLARQESMQRLVALKASSRSSDEPQALSQLDHPNIVRIYDQRVFPEHKLTLLYMQYVPGGTLGDCIVWIRNHPRASWNGKRLLESIDRNLLQANQTPPEQSGIRAAIAKFDWPTCVAWIGVQLADGLDYAHSQGILHRDVKPANILLTAEGLPKLADFNVSCRGIAGRAGSAAYFGGSLAYMSPEQLRVAHPADDTQAEYLDERTDLYSLGIVLWELWQGSRPWKTLETAGSWTEAVQHQIDLRSTPLQKTPPPKSATERVLENTLRTVLLLDRDARPATGKELAARLRLALNPKAADRFEPSEKSFTSRVLQLPVFLVAAAIVFCPNVAAAVFNYQYNHAVIEKANFGDLMKKFVADSVVVNWVTFPLGVAILFLISRPMAKAVRRAKQHQQVSESEINWTWNFGHTVSLISGLLWSVAGVALPIMLRLAEPEFRWIDSIHIFVSLVICGGVAWIYPFFGLTLLSTMIYYPKLISRTMSDPALRNRSNTLRQRSLAYLVSAAVVPLLTMALLVTATENSRVWLLATIGVTALGLFASFLAHREIESNLAKLESVLAPPDGISSR
jgi:eukaryotic-like serine/threonine-protein kinase